MKKVGLVAKTATPAQTRMQGLTLTNKPAIKTAIQKFTDSVLSPYRDKLEYQDLQLLQARAYYDVSTYYEPDGSVKPLDQLTHEARLAIDDVTEDFKGKDADVRTVKYKLADRMQARKELGVLLNKSEEGGSEDAMPQDRRERLNDLFQAGAAGAAGAIAFMKQQGKKPAIDTSNAQDAVVIPARQLTGSTSAFNEALKRHGEKAEDGKK
jgi:hypothetical protein